MGHVICAVEPDSIADQLGILPGDELMRMNGENVIDWVDYQALSSAEKMTLLVSRKGVQTEYEFEKDDFEPLGLSFESDMLGGIRNCANRCAFCFVDQLPDGCRETMRVKDDDWRLSLMTGSYVTLTNVGERELDRIIARGASPLYISVHATDPELRSRLIGSERGGEILSQLKKLADGGVSFHTQAVLCPGINDGEALARTIDDLIQLHPACQSLALVPVGLTAHRGGLDEIRPFDREGARAVIELANEARRICLRELGTRFVFPSDEFYLIAGEPLPADSEYEDYAQIDNGVGLCRQLTTEFDDAYQELPEKLKKGGRAKKKIAIATGVSAQPLLKEMLDAHPVTGVDVRVCAIRNQFFGESVTVAGLVTGRDLIAQMKRKGEFDAILITECMVRAEDRRFLDDTPLTEVRRALGCPVVVVGRRGEDLLDAITAFASNKA